MRGRISELFDGVHRLRRVATQEYGLVTTNVGHKALEHEELAAGPDLMLKSRADINLDNQRFHHPARERGAGVVEAIFVCAIDLMAEFLKIEAIALEPLGWQDGALDLRIRHSKDRLVLRV